MLSKTLVLLEEARDALRRSVETVARKGKVTMGPRGHHVIIQREVGAPFATKDGVTVVQEIELEEPCENIRAQLVREAATTTAEAAGDSTSTATLLAAAIFREGLKAVAAGMSPIYLRDGIDAAVRVTRFEKLVRACVIDPVLVVRTALDRAASLAAVLLTTYATVLENRTND